MAFKSRAYHHQFSRDIPMVVNYKCQTLITPAYHRESVSPVAVNSDFGLQYSFIELLPMAIYDSWLSKIYIY